jgi:putative NIF3 family GTP cyclohydrolase 1 type 2
VSGAAVVGNLNRLFRSVTAAAGAFGSDHFRDPATLVLTGEFKHHDALALQRRGVTAIHLGHYASERPVLEVVAAHLRVRHRTLKVELARRDRSPFVAVRARR